MTITRAPTRTIADLSDDERVNPFYAAFLRSVGLPGTHAAALSYGQRKSHADFMAFICRARSAARPAIVRDGRVIDRAAWAAHIEAHAEKEREENLPACKACGELLCGCADHDWAHGRPSPAPPLAAISEPVGGGDFGDLR